MFPLPISLGTVIILGTITYLIRLFMRKSNLTVSGFAGSTGAKFTIFKIVLVSILAIVIWVNV